MLCVKSELHQLPFHQLLSALHLFPYGTQRFLDKTLFAIRKIWQGPADTEMELKRSYRGNKTFSHNVEKKYLLDFLILLPVLRHQPFSHL
ncbi:hypothetical protein Hdeb2414_s0023g00630671 [Helianthus debilis subsp. tardiflorus]